MCCTRPLPAPCTLGHGQIRLTAGAICMCCHFHFHELNGRLCNGSRLYLPASVREHVDGFIWAKQMHTWGVGCVCMTTLHIRLLLGF